MTDASGSRLVAQSAIRTWSAQHLRPDMYHYRNIGTFRFGFRWHMYASRVTRQVDVMPIYQD
jgi:hypothetical protein